MLRHIYIRDFAIVDRLDLDLDPGMTVLTGETGAGKSILLDAMGLCLGDRAASGIVRPGAEKAEITVQFELADDMPASTWLQKQELGDEGECVIRRIVEAGGRSRGFINGRPVPLLSLKALGELLVDLHGQHAHQSLMKTDVQRAVLDEFAGNQALLASVRRHFADWRAAEEALQALISTDMDESRGDLLRYQIGELEALNLTPEDIADLDQEQRRLANAGALIQTCQSVVSALYEDDQSAQSVLGHAIRELEAFQDVDDQLREAQALLDASLVQLQEGCDVLRRFADGTEVDPARLAWVEQRISVLTDLARKHRVRPEDLPGHLSALEEQLRDLDNRTERIQDLQRRVASLEAEYGKAADALHHARNKAAENLSHRVTESMKELGMPGGTFKVELDYDPSTAPAPFGRDQVRFQVRTNPGLPYGPLGKIASGGELSRIGLALQVAAAKTTHIPTLVFDEADAGIGGAVAEVVGRKLRLLGETYQVFCVTHLAQVAAQAHHHFRVSKTTDGAITRTQVMPLAEESRVEEIGRMLGGLTITDSTLNHAREMLSGAC